MQSAREKRRKVAACSAFGGDFFRDFPDTVWERAGVVEVSKCFFEVSRVVPKASFPKGARFRYSVGGWFLVSCLGREFFDFHKKEGWSLVTVKLSDGGGPTWLHQWHCHRRHLLCFREKGFRCRR